MKGEIFMATLVETCVCVAILAPMAYFGHKYLQKKAQEKAQKEQTPVQKEMQNITIKPQAQTDTFIRQPQPA